MRSSVHAVIKTVADEEYATREPTLEVCSDELLETEEGVMVDTRGATDQDGGNK